ncbi:MAG: hypothetical protein H7249_06480 [Chitinophagaceae bacterium]|nr:hypothetical protein [Oligoflexus sp.]
MSNAKSLTIQDYPRIRGMIQIKRQMVLLPSVSLGITLALALTACNFREDKVKADATPAVITATDLHYQNVNDKVIAPYCLGCHAAATSNSGGINLETYAAVEALAPQIQSSAIDARTMPPANAATLPSSAYELLKEWLAAGTPQ